MFFPMPPVVQYASNNVRVPAKQLPSIRCRCEIKSIAGWGLGRRHYLPFCTGSFYHFGGEIITMSGGGLP